MNRLAVPFHGRIIGFPYWNKVGGAAPDPTLIYDTFTDANGTALASHTIAPTNVPATSWTNVFAAMEINDNKARGAAGNGSCKCDAGIADATVTADYAYAAAGVYGSLLLRVTDSSNYWRFSEDQPNAYWFLQERNAGSNTVRATSSKTFTATTYAMKAVCAATTITCYEGGSQIMQYASATFNQTVTKFGMYLNGVASANTMDNFKVVP